MFQRLRARLGIPSAFHRRQFAARERFRSDYRILADSLLAHLDFATVIDIGCANGFLLEPFLAAGRDAVGTEVSPEVLAVVPPELRSRIRIGDFTTSEGIHDLVCCVEVAEHIRPARSDELVATLTRLSRRWIWFTAAPPGQTGHGHINCRPHDDWIARFAARGFAVDRERTDLVRCDLERLAVAVWLRGNGFVLARRSDA